MDPMREASVPVELLIDTPAGPVSLTPERSRLPLPRGLDAEGKQLAYGPYLQALARFLLADSYKPLVAALSRHFRRPIRPESLRKVAVVSEKHGAFYQVARVKVELADTACSLAIDTAVHREQHAVLEEEFAVLTELETLFGLPFLPRAYLLGETVYEGHPAPGQPLKLFIAEWFEGFHEFHLARPAPGAEPIIRVWDSNPEGTFLDTPRSRALYHRAAAILTACLDPGSFRQIYPWHHAAGDFVVRLSDGLPELRLITARSYRRLGAEAADTDDPWISIVHFFLNLTLRMRIDRLEGTGDLAWADADSVEPVVRGFFQAWREKTMNPTALPSAGDVLDVFRSFTEDEWLSIAEPVLEDGLMEPEEYPFLAEQMEEHVRNVVEALKSNAGNE